MIEPLPKTRGIERFWIYERRCKNPWLEDWIRPKKSKSLAQRSGNLLLIARGDALFFKNLLQLSLGVELHKIEKEL